MMSKENTPVPTLQHNFVTVCTNHEKKSLGKTMHNKSRMNFRKLFCIGTDSLGSRQAQTVGCIHDGDEPFTSVMRNFLS